MKRNKYTVTDLYKLKNPLKLITDIEGLDSDYVDRCFENFEADVCNTTRSFKKLFFNPKLKYFLDDKLPGLTHSDIKRIKREYFNKKVERGTMENPIKSMGIFMLKPKEVLSQRVFPLSKEAYRVFAQRSRKHFKAVAYCTTRSFKTQRRKV
jgi:hypothetical protein